MENTKYVGIYFVRAIGTNLIKIGISRTDILTRIKSIQGNSPLEVEIISFIPCDINLCNQLEMEIHKEFDSYRHHGEWFNLEDIEPYNTDICNEINSKIGLCLPRQYSQQKGHKLKYYFDIKTVYDYIKNSPGCTVEDISCNTGFSTGKVYTHTNTLKKYNRIIRNTHKDTHEKKSNFKFYANSDLVNTEIIGN